MATIKSFIPKGNTFEETFSTENLRGEIGSALEFASDNPENFPNAPELQDEYPDEIYQQVTNALFEHMNILLTDYDSTNENYRDDMDMDFYERILNIITK